MSNTTPFNVSEKFTGATYAKSIALEDEIVVAADEVPDEEEYKVSENVAEDATEVMAESAIEEDDAS